MFNFSPFLHIRIILLTLSRITLNSELLNPYFTIKEHFIPSEKRVFFFDIFYSRIFIYIWSLIDLFRHYFYFSLCLGPVS